LVKKATVGRAAVPLPPPLPAAQAAVSAAATSQRYLEWIPIVVVVLARAG
jgi:hypothetical protein